MPRFQEVRRFVSIRAVSVSGNSNSVAVHSLIHLLAAVLAWLSMSHGAVKPVGKLVAVGNTHLPTAIDNSDYEVGVLD
jgi:hypothetical protein